MGFKGALLTGFVSRSSKTINQHRLFRDGHATFNDFFELARKDSERILKAQEKGYAFLSHGQLDWLDLLRPIAASFEGFEKRDSGGEDAAGPVTRWFRTNTFYRKPHVCGLITSGDFGRTAAGDFGRTAAGGTELAEFVPAMDDDGILFLPGPYSFARLVENSHYANGPYLAADYVQAIAANCPRLVARGYKTILFSEPSFGYDFSLDRFDSKAWQSDCLTPLKEWGVTVGINFPLADAARAIPLIEDSVVDFVGVDAVYTDFSAMDTDKDIALGVVDGARIGIETEDRILRTVEDFKSTARFSGNYYICPNDRLSDVPFRQGLKKIKVLAKVSGHLERSSEGFS